jgi:hypothetical protein
MGDIKKYLITIYWPIKHICVLLELLESKIGKKQVFTLQPCIDVWGTPLGSFLEAMLQDPSLILIMKNENSHKEQSGGLEPLATALIFRRKSSVS